MNERERIGSLLQCRLASENFSPEAALVLKLPTARGRLSRSKKVIGAATLQ
jgi:hypothetical protein